MFSISLPADDDSDNCPHDLEGNNSDLELGNDEFVSSFKGHSSFTQMQVRREDHLLNLSLPNFNETHSHNSVLLSTDKRPSRQLNVGLVIER